MRVDEEGGREGGSDTGRGFLSREFYHSICFLLCSSAQVSKSSH